MENLSVYIPSDRRQALIENKTLPDRSNGAALFADLSGFTQLTEALSLAYGVKRGAEEITAYLNQVYDALIVLVERYGGSIIGFSGDAMTCWFDRDDGLRAIGSALEIQKAMLHFTNITVPQQAPVALSVKVAVASGPIRRFLVGDPSIRYMDVIAGTTMDRLALTEQAASRGEILADEMTLAGLEQHVQFNGWRGEGAERFAVITGLESQAMPKPMEVGQQAKLNDYQVRPWLIPAVYDRLQHGQGAFISELRSAVPVFIKFSGIDFDSDESAGIKLDAYIQWAQHIFAKYDGTLLELTVGDKGSYFYGALGAPTAHDDDALRAVACANELRKLPAELNFIKDIQIGISRGRMRVGPYGGTTRRSYSAIGDETNVAARLMQKAAAGEIIVSKNIAGAVEHRFQLNSLGTIQLKGKTEPITVFSVLGSRSDASSAGGVSTAIRRQASIVGRSEERAALMEQIQLLIHERRGGITIIEGDAGIGKSRLVEEMMAEGRSAGATCLMGAGDAIEQTALYHAWKPIFLQLLGLNLLPDDVATRRDYLFSVLQEFDGDLINYAPLFSAIAPLDMPENETTSMLGGQVRAETTRDFLARLVAQQIKSSPLLIVLEDAHWLDSSSWALVQRIAALSESLLLVIATRPLGERAPQEYQQISAVPAVKRFTLGPLESNDSVEIVKQRLDVHELPAPLAGLIQEKAAGNPFYCEELAYSLRDAKQIVLHDGVCELAPGTDLKQISFPARVEDIIISRIDLLVSQQQIALKVASAIGRIFAYQILYEIYPVREDAPYLVENLNALSKVDLTLLDTPEPDLSYMFKHIITQEVAYNLMLFQQRRSLHQAIAQWYEQKHADDLPNYFSTLAYHWNKVAEGDDAKPETINKAIDYLFKAGNQAMQNFANVEASVHFKNALALLAKLPPSVERDHKEYEIQPLLAYSIVSQRGYGDPEVEAAYKRASDLSVGIQHTAQQAFILYGIFSYHASRGEYQPASEFAERIYALGEGTNDPMMLSMANQCKCIVAFCRGDLASALTHAQLSYDLAEPLERMGIFAIGEDFQAYTCAWLALAQMLNGYPDQSRRTFEHALSMTQNQPYPHCFVLGFAFLPQLLHDIPATFARSEELVGISQKYSFVLLGLQGNIFRAWALATAQKEPMGIQILEGTAVVPKFVKLDSFVPWYLALLAEGRSSVGNYEGALQAVDEALSYAERAGGNFYKPELYRVKGDIFKARGDSPADVEPLYREAVTSAQSISSKWWELRASISLARLLQLEHKNTEARALLEPVYNWFTEGQDTPDLLEARSLLAELQ